MPESKYDRYNRSEKGRLRRARYAGSPKQLAVISRYESTAKALLRRIRYNSTLRGNR